MAGKASRRGGDVQLSKTARASLGDKGAASTSEFSKHACNECHQPIPVRDMVVIREMSAGRNLIAHYHMTCSGLPAN